MESCWGGRSVGDGDGLGKENGFGESWVGFGKGNENFDKSDARSDSIVYA